MNASDKWVKGSCVCNIFGLEIFRCFVVVFFCGGWMIPRMYVWRLAGNQWFELRWRPTGAPMFRIGFNLQLDLFSHRDALKKVRLNINTATLRHLTQNHPRIPLPGFFFQLPSKRWRGFGVCMLVMTMDPRGKPWVYHTIFVSISFLTGLANRSLIPYEFQKWRMFYLHRPCFDVKKISINLVMSYFPDILDRQSQKKILLFTSSHCMALYYNIWFWLLKNMYFLWNFQ